MSQCLNQTDMSSASSTTPEIDKLMESLDIGRFVSPPESPTTYFSASSKFKAGRVLYLARKTLLSKLRSKHPLRKRVHEDTAILLPTSEQPLPKQRKLKQHLRYLSREQQRNRLRNPKRKIDRSSRARISVLRKVLNSKAHEVVQSLPPSWNYKIEKGGMQLEYFNAITGERTIELPVGKDAEFSSGWL